MWSLWVLELAFIIIKIYFLIPIFIFFFFCQHRLHCYSVQLLRLQELPTTSCNSIFTQRIVNYSYPTLDQNFSTPHLKFTAQHLKFLIAVKSQNWNTHHKCTRTTFYYLWRLKQYKNTNWTKNYLKTLY